MTLWDAFAWVGIAAALVMLAGSAGIALWMAIFYAPRVNIGRPPNHCEFRAAKSREAAPFNRYGIRWWAGLSSRRRPKWFVGIMRWERIE